MKTKITKSKMCTRRFMAMLITITLIGSTPLVAQTGTISRAVTGGLVNHKHEIWDLLSEPIFWIIIIFLLVCVGVYKATKD